MRSQDRVRRIAELAREAERLARQEAYQQHNEPRMARLALTLWICRDAADECFEDALAVDGRTQPGQRRRLDRDDG